LKLTCISFSLMFSARFSMALAVSSAIFSHICLSGSVILTSFRLTSDVLFRPSLLYWLF